MEGPRPLSTISMALGWVLLLSISFSLSVLAASTPVTTEAELRMRVTMTPDLSIEIAPGRYEFTTPIPIARRVSIYAAQTGTVTLSGRSSNRIFELLLKAEVTLTNLTLVDGKGEAPPGSAAASFGAPDGGGCIAAYTLSSSTLGTATSLVMNNVEFRRCTTSTGYGGAVLLHLPFLSTFRCVNCTFEENTAKESGGAIHFQIFAGGPFNIDIFRVESSLFRNNSAKTGGAVAIEGPALDLRFDSVEFRDNRASNGGGAVLLLEDLSVTRSTFEGNFASNVGNAVEIVGNGPILSMDNMTTFINNGGVDGFATPIVVKRAFESQVQVLVFTPAPTPNPIITFPPVPSAPPITLPPSVPSTAISGNPSGSSSNDFTAVGVGIALGLLVMVMVLVFAVARKRRESSRATMANQQRAAEAQHNAFAHRRKRPKVVSFTELMPMEVAESPCSICGEPRVDASTVNRCLGTISANKYKINSIPALTAMYAKVECGHVYHAACLIVWTEVNDRNSCPTCRHEIAFEGIRRQSSFNSSDSSLDKPGSGRGSLLGTDASAAAMTNSQMVISMPSDMPFSHEARRSANNDDQQAEQNAILMRELDSLQSRRTGGGSSSWVGT